MQFNMCNEPWSKYSMQGVADRGLKPAQLTSARLHREVLFVESYRYSLLSNIIGNRMSYPTIGICIMMTCIVTDSLLVTPTLPKRFPIFVVASSNQGLFPGLADSLLSFNYGQNDLSQR